MNHKTAPNFQKFESLLGYQFTNKVLLQSALTHPSFFRDAACPFPFEFHFQRLEFLGDAILRASLSQQVFTLFPNDREGFLSEACSILVRSDCLVKIAHKLQLPHFLRTETMRIIPPSVFEDAVEALIGSISLDSNFETAKTCILNWFEDIKHYVLLQVHLTNPKGQLQEKLGRDFTQLRYETQRITELPSPLFKTVLYYKEEKIGEGQGESKKDAEESAARCGLQSIQSRICNKVLHSFKPT